MLGVERVVNEGTCDALILAVGRAEKVPANEALLEADAEHD